jgi:hypothetical protein
MATRSIEIDFGQPVRLTREDEIAFVELAARICDRYKSENPGRTMWPFGIGDKMLTNPFMASDDEPLEFDETVFHIDCHEREDFEAKCVKCGHRQGDHKGLILDPPAGDCIFQAATAQ